MIEHILLLYTTDCDEPLDYIVQLIEHTPYVVIYIVLQMVEFLKGYTLDSFLE